MDVLGSCGACDVTATAASVRDRDDAAEAVRRSGDRSTGTLHDPQPSLRQEPAGGFVALPARWIVGRPPAWKERWRRMVMHHHHAALTSTARAWLAEPRILLSRLAPGNRSRPPPPTEG